jgi:hypothetical protein
MRIRLEIGLGAHSIGIPVSLRKAALKGDPELKNFKNIDHLK